MYRIKFNPYSQAEDALIVVRREIAALREREQKLETFLNLGKELFADQIGAHHRKRIPLILSDSTASALKSMAESGQRMSMKASVLNLARKAIEERGSIHTRDLVAYIEATGVTVTGADKSTTVSVILSRSDDFVSDRSKGWSLKEQTPQDAPTSAGSAPV